MNQAEIKPIATLPHKKMVTNTDPWSDLSPENIDAFMLAMFKQIKEEVGARRNGLSPASSHASH